VSPDFCANLFLPNSDERPSSKGSSENSRPSSSRSQMRPGSRQSHQKSLRSFQSYGQDLNANSRLSSSSGRRSQLQTARSMTSMSQYHDPNPRFSGRSPSPAFYSSQGRYSAYDDADDDLNYPVESIPYNYDSPNYHGIGRSISPGPRSPIGVPSNLRQTPSPLRWAMQDLMNSLDTMSPPLPQAPSPPDESYHRRILHNYEPHDNEGYPDDGWDPPDPRETNAFDQTYESTQNMAPYMYPVDMRPPPLLNYVDKMQSKLDRFQNYQYPPQRDDFEPNERYKQERSPSRVSANSGLRPRSAHSVDKPLPMSPTFQPPPIPPVHRHRETGSITSHSTKHSIFSTTASDYSTAASSVSNSSAGSAGAFARRKAQQRKQEQEHAESRTALSVLPKANSNSALKRRKSYGSSLKKTIGKLLNTSPTKPPPGTVTDHGDKIIEWQNVRRDVNRANTPSAQERMEHRERLEMSEGLEVIRPIEQLERIIEGDESANGSPILPDETFDIASKFSQPMQLTC